MSVVAVRVTDVGYELASDSISVRWTTQRKGDHTSMSKLFEENGAIVGAVGSAEEVSMIRLFLKTHSIAASTESAILEFLAEFSEWKKKRNDSAKVENAYLIGVGDRVFSVNGWHIEDVKTFEAIGAGMDFALAALHLGHTPKQAVQTAIELSVYCEGPVQHVSHIRDPLL